MHESTRTEGAPGRAVRVLLTLTIIELALATAYIHLNLGGMLFTLNGFGYLVFAAAYAITAAVALPVVSRFGWLPRLALAGYTLTTIGAYLVIGPYFQLGWIAKAIEVAIVALVAADLLGTYGSMSGIWSAILGSLRRRPRSGLPRTEAIRVE